MRDRIQSSRPSREKNFLMVFVISFSIVWKLITTVIFNITKIIITSVIETDENCQKISSVVLEVLKWSQANSCTTFFTKLQPDYGSLKKILRHTWYMKIKYSKYDICCIYLIDNKISS